jgi:RNA 3'-terminal phosphate cyclase (ATP)
MRIALSLSAILKKPVRISKIRAGRSKPGLAAQHLKGVELLGEICKATVKGASLGSTEVEFNPNTIEQGMYFADPRTAGCISLLIQIVLPVTYFANGPIVLELKGGTNCSMAPQIDFITEVFRPNLEKFGCSFDFDLKKRGYFPKGGGHCVVNINPVKSILPVNLTNFGVVQKLYGWSFVAGSLPVKVAHEMADGAKRGFTRSQQQVRDINIESYKEDHSMAPDNCTGIV